MAGDTPKGVGIISVLLAEAARALVVGLIASWALAALGTVW